MEDRGTLHWIYHDPNTNDYSFGWFRNARKIYHVSVPIGWQLNPDDCCGVCLINLFNKRLTPYEVWDKSNVFEDGFKLKNTNYIVICDNSWLMHV